MNIDTTKFNVDGAEPTEPALLCTLTDHMQANMMIAALDDQGIPVLRKDRGLGQYTTIVLGFSFQGVDIYVPAQFLCAAQEIYDVVIGPGNGESVEFPSEDAPETDAFINSNDQEWNTNDQEWNTIMSHSAHFRHIKMQILLIIVFVAPLLIYLIYRFK